MPFRVPCLRYRVMGYRDGEGWEGKGGGEGAERLHSGELDPVNNKQLWLWHYDKHVAVRRRRSLGVLRRDSDAFSHEADLQLRSSIEEKMPTQWLNCWHTVYRLAGEKCGCGLIIMPSMFRTHILTQTYIHTHTYIQRERERERGVCIIETHTSLLATVERRKLAWFGHFTRHDSLSKPSFRAPWKVGDAVISRRNAGWTTSKSGHICQCQDCKQGSPAEKTGRGYLLKRPSCSSEDPIGQGT